MNLQDIIDINLLQKVQDAYAEATGLAAITVDFRGNPITKYSNFSPFCNLVRSNPQLVDSCYKCDAYGGFEAARRETSYIYRCHAGLVDFAVPIIVRGQLLGSMMVGQVKIHEDDKTDLDTIAKETTLWKDDPKIQEEYVKVPVITYERIKAAADMMFHVVNNLYEKDIMKYAQEEIRIKNEQLIQQMKVQAELEKALSEKQIQTLQLLVNPHFFFNVMNTMSCMAIMENAEKTQDIIMTLTDIMKYALANNREFVPLKDEIAYVENYLKMQYLRLGDRLNVSIDIPEELQTIKIPPMILQSIIDNAVIHGIEPMEGEGIIAVIGYIAGDDAVIQVSDNGVGISEEKVSDIFRENNQTSFEQQIKGIGLKHANKVLTSHFGNNYSIKISRNKEGGTIVSMKVPKN